MSEKKLTQKQEAFCVAYIETGNASEAYRTAYKSTSMKAASVNREAKALTDNPKIAARLAEMRAPVLEASQMTLEAHLQRLRDLSEAAEEDGKYAAAVAAEVARGRASGFYTEKIELNATIAGLAERMRAQKGK
jgi:phage terminase small subunit